jgi:hypothetical protein
VDFERAQGPAGRTGERLQTLGSTSTVVSEPSIVAVRRAWEILDRAPNAFYSARLKHLIEHDSAR